MLNVKKLFTKILQRLNRTPINNDAQGYDPEKVIIGVSENLDNFVEIQTFNPTIGTRVVGLGSQYLSAWDSDNSAFLYRIPIDKLVNGGTIQYGNSSPDDQVTSVASGSWKVIGSFTLPPGTYLVNAMCRFNSNAAGYRGFIGTRTNTAGTSTVISVSCQDYSGATNGSYTFCRWAASFVVTTETTFYLQAYQNSGAALTIAPRVTAVRLA